MEDTNKIAIFHYKTEQNIRALSLYGGNISKSLPYQTDNRRQQKLNKKKYT